MSAAASAAAGVDARPLYELLEPRPTAPPAGLAAVERLLGAELLEALVVAPADAARARATLVAARAPARVVVATSASARLPAWAAWFADEARRAAALYPEGIPILPHELPNLRVARRSPTRRSMIRFSIACAAYFPRLLTFVVVMAAMRSGFTSSAWRRVPAMYFR